MPCRGLSDLFILELMLKSSRRAWIHLSTAALGLAGASGVAAEPASKRRIRLGVSSYSYWHFKGDQYPIESVIDEAGRLGFDGVELLHRQMSGESTAYLNGLKRQAFRNGLDLIQFHSSRLCFAGCAKCAAKKSITRCTASRWQRSWELPLDPSEFRPMENDCLVRRFDEGERRRAAASRLHQRGRAEVVYRFDLPDPSCTYLRRSQ
jgi:hypothetical protein